MSITPTVCGILACTGHPNWQEQYQTYLTIEAPGAQIHLLFPKKLDVCVLHLTGLDSTICYSLKAPLDQAEFYTSQQLRSVIVQYLANGIARQTTLTPVTFQRRFLVARRRNDSTRENTTDFI